MTKSRDGVFNAIKSRLDIVFRRGYVNADAANQKGVARINDSMAPCIDSILCGFRGLEK